MPKVVDGFPRKGNAIMRTIAAAVAVAAVSTTALPAEAQQYFMRRHLNIGMNEESSAPSYDGTWETSDANGGSCALDQTSTAMVKMVDRTARCEGGECDPATRPREGRVSASCRPVCDGTVQPKRNGKVVTENGRSTEEVFLGQLGTGGWNAGKAISCEAQAVNLGKRLFGCTTFRGSTSGATYAWMGDFTITTGGATVSNNNLDYVSCRYI